MAPPTIAERIARHKCEECRILAAGINRHSALNALFKQCHHHQNSGGDLTATQGMKRGKMREEEEDDNLRSYSTDESGQEIIAGRPKRQLDEPETKGKKILQEDASSSEESKPLRKKRRNKECERLSKTARWLLNCPPNEATRESLRWQTPFVQMKNCMPKGDKLSPAQPVVLEDSVTSKALEIPVLMKMIFEPCPDDEDEDFLKEENERPWVIGLIAGLLSLVGEEKVVVQNSPVKYFVERVINGVRVWAQTCPPGEAGRAIHERVETTIVHGREVRKVVKWKMDFLIKSAVQINGKTVWMPRDLIEAKGYNASFQNMYQASMSGCRLQLKRLQDGQPVERLYIEVWGTVICFYGILDIFGYVTVKKGIVTAVSFTRFQQSVEEQKARMGDSFPADSYERCPKTLAEIQTLYDEHAEAFYGKYKGHLPSKTSTEDFPVGILYLNDRARIIPTGGVPVPRKEAASFVQGHARVLMSNAAVKGDCTQTRLLQNMENFLQKLKNQGMRAVFGENLPQEKLPDAVIYPVSVSSSHSTRAPTLYFPPSDTSGPLPHRTEQGDAQCSMAGDTSGLRRDALVKWRNEDVVRAVALLCGSQFTAAVVGSGMNGKLLSVMTEANLEEWLISMGVNLVGRLKFKVWWREGEIIVGIY